MQQLAENARDGVLTCFMCETSSTTTFEQVGNSKDKEIKLVGHAKHLFVPTNRKVLDMKATA